MPVLKPLTALRNRNVLPPQVGSAKSRKYKTGNGYDYGYDWVFSSEVPISKKNRKRNGE